MRNCSLRGISPFATIFSKLVCCRGVRKRGKGLNDLTISRKFLQSVLAMLQEYLPYRIQDKCRCQPINTIRCKNTIRFTFSHLQTHFDAFSPIDFLKTLTKGVSNFSVCRDEFVPHYQLLIFEDFPGFYPNVSMSSASDLS